MALCAYVVPDPDEPGAAEALEPSMVRGYLYMKLPDYMVPSYIIKIDQLPLTAQGKVDRSALPLPGPVDAESRTPAVNSLEKQLAALWSRVLEKKTIGIDDDFFHLGGHSLTATVLLNLVQKELHIQIPLSRVFHAPTIRGMADYIMKQERQHRDAIAPVEQREYYSQSSAQKRLFMLDQYRDIGTGYNMPFVLKAVGELDFLRFESAVRALIRRHDVFRTSFHVKDNIPVQKVHPVTDVSFEIESIQARDDEAGMIKRFIRPFDLASAPLLRVGTAPLSERETLLLYDVHHIIADGTSVALLMEEFTRLYAGETLAPLAVQYKDFAVWQNQMVHSGVIRKQEQYWQKVFGPKAGSIPVLDLPTDFPRPGVFRYSGEIMEFSLEGKLYEALTGLVKQGRGTLYMNLLAILNVLLHKLTGQEDIVVGCGVAGRRHWSLHDIAGMFVNVLPMRNFPKPGETFGQFLEQVISHSLEAFENQDVQFEQLVETLNIPHDPSRFPLYAVDLTVQNFQSGPMEVKDVTFLPCKMDNKTAKIDMNIFAFEKENSILFSIRYCTALFKPGTIRRFSEDLLKVIDVVSAEKEIRIKDISIHPGSRVGVAMDRLNRETQFFEQLEEEEF
jgi:acyl carrier protein